ncbi:MAG TPA: ABC transporter ATP-binding protein [Candidatus Caldiarchaeum subterraneum]|uniref:Nickel import system ATP-binding protein NikD n=1 Tax=Caldiarchaeum subterraneum TaxID=311458 RepID=A0A832ZX44_CALS0|nr:ABC transporter ATP-binding protein [Candidatus Caldarchaeum subterraneum]
MEKIAEVENLVLRFYTYEGIVKALEKVSFAMKEGETLGIVGETGSGKTATALTFLGIILPPGKVEDGSIRIKSGDRYIDVIKADKETLRKIRGKLVSMIFQEPSQALNPVYTVEEQVGEALLAHIYKDIYSNALKEINEQLSQLEENRNVMKRIRLIFDKMVYERLNRNADDKLAQFLSHIPILKRYRRWMRKVIRRYVIELLKQMDIPDPERVASSYPHELSGGMRQRVVIAIALACRPVLLIADEPTTALDVTVEAQILDLIRKLKKDYGTTIAFITHDLGVIAEMADRVVVMYAGNVVEIADVKEIFRNPLHPYTKALLKAIPKLGTKELYPIEGTIPNLVNPPNGCRFHPRCPYVFEKCIAEVPQLREVKEGHYVACHLY